MIALITAIEEESLSTSVGLLPQREYDFDNNQELQCILSRRATFYSCQFIITCSICTTLTSSKIYKRRFADKSGKLQSTPSMLKPCWPHLYPQNQWSLWVCYIVVISLLHGTSRRHVDWLVGMMRLDEWNHTGDIVMDNTQLFRALHFANGGWQWALEMIEAHIKHDNPWCCCYGRSPWFWSF